MQHAPVAGSPLATLQRVGHSGHLSAFPQCSSKTVPLTPLLFPFSVPQYRIGEVPIPLSFPRTFRSAPGHASITTLLPQHHPPPSCTFLYALRVSAYFTSFRAPHDPPPAYFPFSNFHLFLFPCFVPPLATRLSPLSSICHPPSSLPCLSLACLSLPTRHSPLSAANSFVSRTYSPFSRNPFASHTYEKYGGYLFNRSSKMETNQQSASSTSTPEAASGDVATPQTGRCRSGRSSMETRGQYARNACVVAGRKGGTAQK